MTSPPADFTPKDLTEQLEIYSRAPTTPQELVQLVRPARLQLRDIPLKSREEYGHYPQFWETLAKVWEGISRSSLGDQAERDAIQAMGAFLISLTTQNKHNQMQAILNVEESLREILITASSLFNLEDAAYQSMTRTLCQALANLVTANEEAASLYFPKRLESENEDQLLQRLLATPDEGTLQALLIFILNSIHSSPSRALLLGTSPMGSIILDRILILISSIYDHDSENKPAPSFEQGGNDVFSLAFAIVQQIIILGVFPQTYLAHPLMEGYSISPSLIILLKFLDGHLSLPSTYSAPIPPSLIQFLFERLEGLSKCVLEEGGEEGGRRARDASDAQVFQGVVLVMHCLVEIGLGREAELSRRENLGEELGDEKQEEEEGLRDENGLELVIRLLNFSKTSIPLPAPRPPPITPKIVELPSLRPTTTPTPDDSPNIPAYQLLKLVCVKYLGIISFASPTRPLSPTIKAGIERVQDLIREKGGLGLLLGMCQIDGQNPTLREHALFAIRNILKGNLKNQDYIESLKPEYKVLDDGSLEDLPPALRPTN